MRREREDPAESGTPKIMRKNLLSRGEVPNSRVESAGRARRCALMKMVGGDVDERIGTETTCVKLAGASGIEKRGDI